MNYEVVNTLTIIEKLAQDARVNIARAENLGTAAKRPMLAVPGQPAPPTAAQLMAGADKNAKLAEAAINQIIGMALELQKLGASSKEPEPKPEPDLADECETPASAIAKKAGQVPSDVKLPLTE